MGVGGARYAAGRSEGKQAVGDCQGTRDRCSRAVKASVREASNETGTRRPSECDANDGAVCGWEWLARRRERERQLGDDETCHSTPRPRDGQTRNPKRRASRTQGLATLARPWKPTSRRRARGRPESARCFCCATSLPSSLLSTAAAIVAPRPLCRRPSTSISRQPSSRASTLQRESPPALALLGARGLRSPSRDWGPLAGTQDPLLRDPSPITSRYLDAAPPSPSNRPHVCQRTGIAATLLARPSALSPIPPRLDSAS